MHNDWVMRLHSPSNAPSVSGGYSQGVEIAGPGRWLHISGQIPTTTTGEVASDFETQCRQVWTNLKAVLTSAGMTTHDLVKVTTYLSDRRYRQANSLIRREELDGAAPALTVLVSGIYDESWLLEIEAMAFQVT